MPSDHAHKLIDDFARYDHIPAFTRADRATVAKQMRDRVDNPFLINQGQAGVCGPASMAFDILSSQPASYVDAVTDLFDWGLARIGEWWIQPRPHLLQGGASRPMAIS